MPLAGAVIVTVGGVDTVMSVKSEQVPPTSSVTIIVTVWVVGVSAVVANAKILVLEGLTAPR
jgi:hypothetical protein